MRETFALLQEAGKDDHQFADAPPNAIVVVVRLLRHTLIIVIIHETAKVVKRWHALVVLHVDHKSDELLEHLENEMISLQILLELLLLHTFIDL